MQLRAIGLKRDLEEEWRQLVAAYEAFKNTVTVVNPPSKEVIAEGTRLAKELAALVAENLLADDKLEAVIGVVSALGALATKPAPAAPGAEVAAASRVNFAGLRMESSHTRWLEQMRKLPRQ